MTSLTDLPTKCRFAVLEVSDEEDDENPQTSGRGGKAGSTKQTDANNAVKTKKKKKKKRSRAKHNQSSEPLSHVHVEPASHVDQDLLNGNETNDPVADVEEWDEWKQKDEQYVVSQFQRDLKEALEASKKEATQQKKSNPEVVPENNKDKKKKEKPVVMSLDEFVAGHSEENTAPTKTDKYPTVSGLDEFLDWPEESSTIKGNSNHFDSWNSVPSSELPQLKVLKEEKPPLATAKSSKLSRKKNNSKSEDEARNRDQETASDKKLLTATKEDQIQAEMVHIKDELDKTGHELIELRQAKIEHTKTIKGLKEELFQVKKRNKQLCFILSQAEMKEKSELLMQIEELNEVKEQVVQLHAELEQERSRSSALKSELGKASGRARHGSSS